MAKKNWDDASNEAQNNFMAFSEVGDYVVGTLIATKKVASTLPDRVGELQPIYELKVSEGQYHKLDEKKRVIKEPIVLEAGEIISVGGRKMIDSRMARAKIGQVIGLKFTEELAPKTKGYNPTKLVKVFMPKGTDGEFEMDTEWLETQKAESGDF